MGNQPHLYESLSKRARDPQNLEKSLKKTKIIKTSPEFDPAPLKTFALDLCNLSTWPQRTFIVNDNTDRYLEIIMIMKNLPSF